MSVEHAENLNLGPVLRSYNFLRRLNDIQNDGYSVLVALPHCAYVGVCRERTHSAKGLAACLRRLEKRQSRVNLRVIFLD